MKKTLYLLSALILPFGVMAQPVIDSAEYYHVGQHFNLMFCDATNPGPAGASQTWDFSTVNDSISIGVDANASVSPANIQLLEGDNTYYLNVSDTQTVITGIDMTVGNITYSPSYVLLVKHPVTYLDTAVDSFASSVDVSNPPLLGAGTSAMKADGYGTLITKEDTFHNTLRVRSAHIEHDTGLIGNEYVNFISYLWYDSSHVYPLMRIDSVIGTGSFPIIQVSSTYYTTDTTTGVKTVSKNSVSGNAYFDNNGLVIKTELLQDHQYKLGMINLNGQIVYSTTFTATGSTARFSFNNQMPAGTYFISLSELNGKTQPLTIKVLKQ